MEATFVSNFPRNQEAQFVLQQTYLDTLGELQSIKVALEAVEEKYNRINNDWITRKERQNLDELKLFRSAEKDTENRYVYDYSPIQGGTLESIFLWHKEKKKINPSKIMAISSANGIEPGTESEVSFYEEKSLITGKSASEYIKITCKWPAGKDIAYYIVGVNKDKVKVEVATEDGWEPVDLGTNQHNQELTDFSTYSKTVRLTIKCTLIGEEYYYALPVYGVLNSNKPSEIPFTYKAPSNTLVQSISLANFNFQYSGYCHLSVKSKELNKDFILIGAYQTSLAPLVRENFTSKKSIISIGFVPMSVFSFPYPTRLSSDSIEGVSVYSSLSKGDYFRNQPLSNVQYSVDQINWVAATNIEDLEYSQDPNKKSKLYCKIPYYLDSVYARFSIDNAISSLWYVDEDSKILWDGYGVTFTTPLTDCTITGVHYSSSTYSFSKAPVGVIGIS
jgi:hypothetical protein